MWSDHHIRMLKLNGQTLNLPVQCLVYNWFLLPAHLQAEGVGGLPCASDLTNRDGTPMFKPDRPILATDRVRYVGEPVAFIVADTLHTAMEAADAIEIDYSELDAASNTRKAIHSSAAIWDEAPDNVSFHTSSGDDSNVTEALNERSSCSFD